MRDANPDWVMLLAGYIVEQRSGFIVSLIALLVITLAAVFYRKFVKASRTTSKPGPGPAQEPPMREVNTEGVMSFVGHLSELRSRLIVSLIAVMAAAIAAFIFSDRILLLLKAPAGNIVLHVFSPMDGFFIKWKVSLLGGIAFASPLWIYQLVRFVLPGLTDQEKRVVKPLIGVASLLFALGVSFGYYLMYGMIKVLIKFFGSQLDYFPAADAYISFVTFFLLSTGIAFELPVLLYALVRLHIITTTTLRKQRRYFYFAMFVFAEIITPVADPIVAPLTIMAPMVLLYEITLAIASVGERTRRTPAVEEQPVEVDDVEAL